MASRTTAVDGVLQALGVVVIFICLIAAALSWPSGATSNTALRSLMIGFSAGYVIYGLIGGFVLIGFGTLIRLLDEIRGQGEVALGNERRVERQDIEHGDDTALAEESGPDEKGIMKNADGTFTVYGRTYKSRSSAEAYLDLIGETSR